MLIRKQVQKFVSFSNVIFGLLVIICALLIHYYGTIPVVEHIVAYGTVLVFSAFYSVLIVGLSFGVLRIILGVLSWRGGSVPYGLLVIWALYSFVIALAVFILSLYGILTGSVNSVNWTDIVVNFSMMLLFFAYFLFHLLGISVVSPKFCRKYRPLCLVRR